MLPGRYIYSSHSPTKMYEEEQKMKKQIVALLAGAMLMLATSSMASPISGNISFVGDLNLTGDSSPVLASNATGIDFVSAITYGGKGGDYASVPLGTPVTFSDFTFYPSSLLPINDLWSFTSGGKTYNFDLLAVTASHDPVNTLALNGTGLLEITGFDNTPGTWSLTTQDGKEGTLTFSSQASAVAPVPEPGSVMLLGVGLLGFAIFGKRRMNV